MESISKSYTYTSVCFLLTCLFSTPNLPSTEPAPSSSSCSSFSVSKPAIHSSSTGDQQRTDLEHIELRFDKNLPDEQLSNTKHSSNNKTNANSGFSLKNPVSSFRSWVSNKKSSKEDSINNHSITSYGKIDTSPTPRKSSVSADVSKRTRTNSASATTSSATNTNQQQQQQQQTIQSNSSSSTTRVKKKSSFVLRNTNPIALLKRTPETNHHQTDLPSAEQTAGTGSGGGPLGYLKQLVRGDNNSSEKKQ